MKNFLQRPETLTSNRILVRPSHEEGMYHWSAIVDGAAQAEVTGDLLQLSQQQQDLPGSELVVILPACKQSLRTLEVTEAERKLYRQTLPYELEDSLVETTEKLHFAYQSLGQDRMGVLVLRRAMVQQLVDDFRESGLGIDALVSEILLLPWSADHQTWLFTGEDIIARTGPCAGFVSTPENLELVASMPDPDGGEPGGQLDIVVEQGVDTTRISAALAAARPGLAVQMQPVESILGWQASVLPRESVNLLQGDFRPALRWRYHWHNWKPVAIAALAAVLVNYVVLIYHYSGARQVSRALEAEKYELVREAIPTGKITSPERQLKAALTQLTSSGPTEFGSMIARVGPALGSAAGYTVRNINYEGDSRSLRLELRARDFQHIEQFRSAAQQRGLDAQLLNSSAQGQGILARLELKEANR
jgi:general secretion pathway protein L